MVRRAAVLGVGLAAALMCTAAWGTELAQSDRPDQTFTDARGDVPLSVDIEKVRVIDDPRLPVSVVVEQRRLLAGDGVIVWIDTNRARPGPEYFAGGIANSNVLGIVTVRSWKDRGTWLQCDGFRLLAGEEQPGDRVVMTIPRRCLGNPPAVRVSVLSLRNGPQGVVHDYAPARYVFYPWVPR